MVKTIKMIQTIVSSMVIIISMVRENKYDIDILNRLKQ
jgi:hypothetical protein